MPKKYNQYINNIVRLLNLTIVIGGSIISLIFFLADVKNTIIQNEKTIKDLQDKLNTIEIHCKQWG